jgi:hypothetical protein
MTVPARALVGNASDEEQVQSAGRKERIADREAASDLRRLIEVPEFKRFLWRTLTFCGPYRTPFDDDDRRTNLNIGRGDVGRYLIEQLEKADPLAYSRIALEGTQAEQKEIAQ